MDETVIERGVRMIIALQALGGIVETPEQARAGWLAMSRNEQETTERVYNLFGLEKEEIS